MNVILTSEARKDLIETRCTIALEILRSAQDDGA
jgi:hypothetical protein